MHSETLVIQCLRNTHSSLHSRDDRPVVCPLPYHSLPLSLQCHPLTLSICCYGNCTAPPTPSTHTHFLPKGHILCHCEKGIKPLTKKTLLIYPTWWKVANYLNSLHLYLLLFSAWTVSKRRKISLSISCYEWKYFCFIEVRNVPLLRYTCMRGTVAYIQEAGWISLEMDTA